MSVSRAEWILLVAVATLGCTLLFVGIAGAGGGPGAIPERHDGASSTTGTVPLVQEFDADRTEFHVRLHANGSATWVFRYEQRLEDDDAREDFERFAETFRTEETDLYRNFVDRAERLAADGSETTDREMAAEAFTRNADVAGLDDNLGVVEMSFRWEGFAPVDDDGRVVVGDVFEGGLYVAPDQRLVFERGEGLAFESTTPDPDDVSGSALSDSDSITYDGERSFTDNRPRVVYAPDDASPPDGTETSGDGEDTTTDGTQASDVGGGWMLPAALLVVLLLGLGAGAAYRSGALPGESDDPVPESTAADAAAETPEEDPTVDDDELIPDDERVLMLLEEHDGRMKQVAIVDETDWSKSKVSMLLSEMEENDQISKLRVGRENIISLPGHEPDAAGSPFDDEG